MIVIEAEAKLKVSLSVSAKKTCQYKKLAYNNYNVRVDTGPACRSADHLHARGRDTRHPAFGPNATGTSSRKGQGNHVETLEDEDPRSGTPGDACAGFDHGFDDRPDDPPPRRREEAQGQRNGRDRRRADPAGSRRYAATWLTPEIGVAAA